MEINKDKEYSEQYKRYEEANERLQAYNKTTTKLGEEGCRLNDNYVLTLFDCQTT